MATRAAARAIGVDDERLELAVVKIANEVRALGQHRLGGAVQVLLPVVDEGRVQGDRPCCPQHGQRGCCVWDGRAGAASWESSRGR